jgi:hypothetical protein
MRGLYTFVLHSMISQQVVNDNDAAQKEVVRHLMVDEPFGVKKHRNGTDEQRVDPGYHQDVDGGQQIVRRVRHERYYRLDGKYNRSSDPKLVFSPKVLQYSETNTLFFIRENSYWKETPIL